MPKTSPRTLPGWVLLLLAPLAGCGGGGGGGGGDGDEDEPQPFLLLEMQIGFSGSYSGVDPDYDIVVEIGTVPVPLNLGALGTDDDGVSLPANPADASFPGFVAALTNGADDLLVIRTVLDTDDRAFSTLDTNEFIRRSAELAGPDLIGATITEIVFRADVVDVVTGSGGRQEISGALLVLGFPQ